MGVLADGMGGKSGGRKAADQVVLTAKQIFERYAPTRTTRPKMLKQIVMEAHLMIKLTAITAEEEPHSTIAAYLIGPKRECDYVHAGDSRMYHFRGSEMVSRTTDHSYVQRLIERGKITEEQANNHPQGNLLTGCLGTPERSAAGQTHVDKLAVGDRCWPAATGCGTTSPRGARRHRARAAAARGQRNAGRARRANARAAPATTCRWR